MDDRYKNQSLYKHALFPSRYRRSLLSLSSSSLVISSSDLLAISKTRCWSRFNTACTISCPFTFSFSILRQNKLAIWSPIYLHINPATSRATRPKCNLTRISKLMQYHSTPQIITYPSKCAVLPSIIHSNTTKALIILREHLHTDKLMLTYSSKEI